MLRKIRKTDFVIGIALGALGGVAICALAIGGLYFAYPDLFEHMLAR